jgi:hypothetical protein
LWKSAPGGDPTKVSDATSGVVVFDREGHKLAELDAIRPGLVLYEHGQIRAALGIAPLGGSLALYRDDGKPVAVLGVDADALTSALSLYGANGEVQAKLITDSSHLFLFGADGNTAVEIACRPSSTGITVSQGGKTVSKAP